ncbi:MAG: hypothetical protein KA149_04545 [Chitinophagales bacterium]|nr:hypothetical protein [Chitinophagales bacterium]
MENEAPFIPEPEISIWIDKYDDVFSEFDSRPFSDRALSDDFLREVRKITSEKTTGEIKLKFHVMEDQRNEESESIIINNLNKHFLHIAEVLKNEAKQDLHRGYILLGLGSALILFLFYLTTIPGEEMPYMSGIHLMLEPVGWFMTWTGLDHVFQISRKGKSTLDFNKRMSVAKIAFSSFEATEAGHQKTVIPIDNQNLRVA